MSVRAMKAGAAEFLTKPFKYEVPLTAIRDALASSRVALEREAELRALQERYRLLTPRERKVMALVVAGQLNKQVAGQLGIADNTVKAHRGGCCSPRWICSFAARTESSSIKPCV